MLSIPPPKAGIIRRRYPRRGEALPRTCPEKFGVAASASVGPSSLCRQDGTFMTPEQIAELRQKRYNARVAWLRKTHSDLMIVRIRPDYPLPAHKPGQYTSIGLGYWE